MRVADAPAPPAAAWYRWATSTDPARLTARQALAAALIQAGITRTPEAALRMLERRR